MSRNMGTWDRRIRALLIAPLALLAAIAVGVGSVFGIVLLALAAIMLGTSAIGYCPLYALVGFSTCPVRRVASQ